jgi:hypothetical protein
MRLKLYPKYGNKDDDDDPSKNRRGKMKLGFCGEMWLDPDLRLSVYSSTVFVAVCICGQGVKDWNADNDQQRIIRGGPPV